MGSDTFLCIQFICTFLMIQDPNWTRRQVINLWLEFTQQQISKKLNISVGKVNSIVQEYNSSNDLAEKARDLFMSAKKNDIKINQLMSNLRYENAIKKFASDEDKIETLLRGLAHLVGNNGGDPDITAKLLYHIIEFLLKEHMYPGQFLEELESSKQQELEVKDRIRRKKLLLQKYNVTLDEILKFNELKSILGQLDVSEMSQIINLIKNIREQHNNPQELLSIVSNFCSISEEVKGLMKRKEKELADLSEIEAESDPRKEVNNTYRRLAKRGLNEQDIADSLNVIEHTVQDYKGIPIGSNFIAYLRNELTKFQSLRVININLRHENYCLGRKIEQSNKKLGDPPQQSSLIQDEFSHYGTNDF